MVDLLCCLNCGSKNVDFPEVPLDEPGAWYDVPHATLEHWSSLSEDEQNAAVEKAIASYHG